MPTIIWSKSSAKDKLEPSMKKKAFVLLFNLQEKGAVWSADDADAKDVQLRERSLVYVAATRARDVLAVSWSGGRPILIPS